MTLGKKSTVLGISCSTLTETILNLVMYEQWCIRPLRSVLPWLMIKVTMQVLDHGEVTLRRHAAYDADIAESARVLDHPEWRGKPDEKLLRFMMQNEHTSPFEHGYMRFYVKAPMFVINQWVRHRTWSFNIQSGRYEDEGWDTEFYIPDQVRMQDRKNRQNSIPSDSAMMNELMNHFISDQSYRSTVAYKGMRDNDIAREVARLVMPENVYRRMHASVDPHNLMHFLYLRMHKDAQWEIRQYAQAIYMIWKELMPVTASIWTEMNADRIGLNE